MKRSPLLPIFLVVLVDVLGFTIVYPLLPFYALRYGATPLIATTLVSVYALCSLLSTPVIGRLSDTYGRRRLLMLSQAGTFAGFIVLGFSEYLWMVFLGRILDGLTAGNLSLAQAYISDRTEPQNRAKAFGIIGIAFGIGFFFGPAMAGWLSTYGLHVPFIVAAGLSLGSMVCTYALLEPGVPAARSGAEGKPGAAAGASGPGGKRPGLFALGTYLEYFGRPGLGSLYLQFFLFCFSFSAFMSGFALFAISRFHWTSRDVSFMFAYAGFLGIIMQGGLLGRLVKRVGEAPLVLAGFAAAVVAYLLLGFAQTLAVLLISSTISSFSNGVLRPVITSELTQRIGRHEQGVAIGISGSLNSFAMMISPPAGGLMLDRDWLLAWTLVPAVTTALGFIVALAGRARVAAAKRAVAVAATAQAPGDQVT
jgi:MFS family permease